MTSLAAAPSSAAQHDAWVDRRLPDVEEVRPGIWSIPVPMPEHALRYVLVYAVALDDGVALVDTGWDSEASWHGLCAGLAATGHTVADVRSVLVTHAHSDHHGLTPRVRQASGCDVAMHAGEVAWLDQSTASATPRDDLRQWLVARGAPPADAAGLVEALEHVFTLTRSLSRPDRLVADGDRPLPGRPDLRAIWTPGHTPGHLCFAVDDERLLLSGDHVLPRITPNLARGPAAADDAVGDYLRSLARVAGEGIDEVLPAHEFRFGDLAARVATMREHHDERLAEIVAAVTGSPGLSSWAVAQQIGWARPWDAVVGIMRQTAVSETYVHLTYLERAGRLRRDQRGIDRWEVA